ncbi:MAG TPA: alpha/beta fold hydrolase [Terracidiphilus sp.]|nr:alpha/beta fold hydrolase [Terracidiphilus sp.]
MTRSKPQPKPISNAQHSGQAPATVSVRWLLTAFAIAIPGAGLCAWGVLCLLFWQGSWQLLYHPAAAVTRTPANVGLAYDPVGFAASDTGMPQIQGWWIPGGGTARYTVLYLHGQDGNLSDTVGDIDRLHSAGVTVLAFDYRGYGQSQFIHPSEASWRQDAEWALEYLSGTRHIDPHSIVLAGSGLGANLALEVAAAHSELGGVVLESPLDAPVDAIFGDPRARLVPARLLVRDRFEMNTAAAGLRIPSLWMIEGATPGRSGTPESDKAYAKVTAPKERVRLDAPQKSHQEFVDALRDWLEGLHR